MKAINILAIALVLAFVAVAQGQIETGIQYEEQVVWRGFPLYGDSSAISPFARFDIKGLDLEVSGYRPTEEDQEENRRLDLSVTKDTQFGKFGYTYYNFPDSSSHTAQADPAHFHEFSWTFDLPKVLVDLSYQLIYLTPFNEGTGEDTGFLHLLKAEKNLQGVDLFAELVYNDGFDPMGLEIDSGFSHVLLGASVDIDMEDIVLRPAVYHQMTFDDGITEDKNQTWYGMSVVYRR